MRTEDVEAQARQLYDAIGPKAIATAAKRAQEQETAGDADAAHHWRRVEERLRSMRGPRQT